jgi:diguanylate cyclase (GGDEF)-like protein
VVLVALLHLVAPDVPEAPGLVVRVAGLCAAAVALTCLVPWERLPRSFQTFPPLMLLTAAVIIRESTGGAASPLAELPLLPMVWLAAYGNRAELSAGLIALVLVTLAPAARGPVAPAGVGTLFLAGVGGALALVLNGVVERLREAPETAVEGPAVDRMTGLPNRALWDQRMQMVMAPLQGVPVCLAVLDVDSFRWFNDRSGRKAGDAFLRDLARVLQAGLRMDDALGRVGGDRFAVLLPRCTLPAAHAIVRHLCRSTPRGLTCSSGIPLWDEDEPPGALLARAEGALRRAKLAGRDRVVIAQAESPARGMPDSS